TCPLPDAIGLGTGPGNYRAALRCCCRTAASLRKTIGGTMIRTAEMVATVVLISAVACTYASAQTPPATTLTIDLADAMEFRAISRIHRSLRGSLALRRHWDPGRISVWPRL